jgi:hypothetical protein
MTTFSFTVEEKVRIPKSITYTVAIAVGVNRETKFRYFVLIPEK